MIDLLCCILLKKNGLLQVQKKARSTDRAFNAKDIFLKPEPQCKHYIMVQILSW